MKKRRSVPIFLYLILLALACSVIIGLFGGVGDDIPYSEVVKLFKEEHVKSFVISENRISLTLHNPYNGETVLTADIADTEAFRAEMKPLLEEQLEKGILESYDFNGEKTQTFYDLIFPLIIVGMVLLFVWMLLASRANAQNGLNNFGKARTVLGVPNGKKVTFQDVAGADEEKAELAEVVDFLRAPQKYTQIGARIPHGLLLVDRKSVV